MESKLDGLGLNELLEMPISFEKDKKTPIGHIGSEATYKGKPCKIISVSEFLIVKYIYSYELEFEDGTKCSCGIKSKDLKIKL